VENNGTMYLQVFDHPQDVTQEELNHYLLQLPQWRREKVLSYRFLIDQVLCAKAYLLLKQGLKSIYGIDEHPKFKYVMHDKPVLSDYPDIHFNLSHCKRGVMCVIDDHPIGCDIEEIEEKLDIDLCHFCYNDSEVEMIVSSTDPCVEFTKLWTKKEATLKLTGEGINNDLPSLFNQDTLDRLMFDMTVRKDKGFVYSVCRYKRT
jgi:4'-phosphopantetheinyl transferase